MSFNDFEEIAILPKCKVSRMNVFFVFAFYTEIQDGGQKWQENDFWQKC